MQEHEPQVEKEINFRDLFLPFTNKKAIVFIILVGIIIFTNSIFNPFQFDDYAQIVNNPLIGSIDNITSFFSRGMAFAGNDSVKMLHMQYRPFYFSLYILIYHFFGNNPIPFHILQLVIHILNSILIFVIFSRFFKRGIAFIISLIFLVHTLNSESVIYIADIQEPLFVLFGLVAFYSLLQVKQSVLSLKKLCFISCMLFFAILTKETGILFSGVILLYSILFNRKNMKRIFMSVSLTLIVYFFIRYLVSLASTADINQSIIQQMSLLVRVQTMPKIVFYYLSGFILPIHLAVGQSWVVQQIDFGNFFLPLIADLIFFFSLIACGIFIYKRAKKNFSLYIFFIVWFLLGMVLHMQIFPLDVTVADRYFYFPMIGLLGLLGVACKSFNSTQILSSQIKSLFLILASLFIVLLCVLTIQRNSQWQTLVGLYQHDIQYAQSPLMDSYYGGILILNGNFPEAKSYLEESIVGDPQLGHNFNNLAVIYEHSKDNATAKKLYQKNIDLNGARSSSNIDVSYAGLAHIALNERDFKDAKTLSMRALKTNALNIHAAEYLAIAEYQLGEKEDAIQTIQKVYTRSPNQETQGLSSLIQNNTMPFPILQNSGEVIY